MAQLKDIVEIEKLRDDISKCRSAYLYRDGTFLRAYEWSAWLFVKYLRKIWNPTSAKWRTCYTIAAISRNNQCAL